MLVSLLVRGIPKGGHMSLNEHTIEYEPDNKVIASMWRFSIPYQEIEEVQQHRIFLFLHILTIKLKNDTKYKFLVYRKTVKNNIDEKLLYKQDR